MEDQSPGMLRQALYLIPFVGDDTIDANAYIVFTGVMGIVGWGINSLGYHLTPVNDAGVRTGQYWGWEVTFAWIAIYGGWLLLSFPSVKKRVQFSPIGLLWIGLMITGTALNVVGFFMTKPLKPFLMWLAWYGYFGIAFLLTGYLVKRGGIYLLTGLVSSALFVVGVGSAAGLIPVDGIGWAKPWPAPFVVLGVLHAVPMIVDGLRGGRELTEAGIPAVRAEETGHTTDAGGVVQAD